MNAIMNFRMVVASVFIMLTGFALQAATVPILRSASADTREKWAASELSTFLAEIYPGDEFPVVTSAPSKGKYIMLGTTQSLPELKTWTDETLLAKQGSFVITKHRNKKHEIGLIIGNNSRGVLDGVYSLLEQKLAYGFYLDANASENVVNEPFSFKRWDLAAQPAFLERTAFNWYNFISGVSAWNLEDYKRWIRQTARMRYTCVMLHAYSWSPFHEFSYHGETKPVTRIQNTQYGALWDNKQTDDVRKLIGGDLFKDEGAVFGADVSKIGYNGVTMENRVAKAKAMMREVVDYAVNTVGMDFNWVIDMDTRYANPQNIIQTLPEESRIRMWDSYIVRPDTKEGYLYFKNMVETIMTDYPWITKLTVWWRGNSSNLYDGLVNSLPYNEKTAGIPEDWRAEYDAAPDYVKTPPDPNSQTIAPAQLYYAKVTQAMRKALNELELPHVKIGFGSWMWSNKDFNSHIPANYFQDPENTAYVLEYKMGFGTTPAFRNRLSKTGKKRDLVVIEWAQHDDGKYMGRPYTPPSDFADKLKEANASGYGVIHWTTRPMDIFFKNLQNQIWSNTLNQSYPQTCEDMALNYFGKSQLNPMKNYLVSWLTTAPQFGRETGYLGQSNVKDFEKRINGCNERLMMLNKVDTSLFSNAALKRYNYFKGHEEWIKLFHQAQQYWDEDLQKQTIHKFIEKSLVDGGMTRGEKGLLIQHNLKWLNKSKEHIRMNEK